MAPVICAFRHAGKLRDFGCNKFIVPPKISVVRSLATDTPSQKFFAIMDEYKSRNYTQTVPARFIKDMRKATDVNGDDEITMDEMRHMLRNIEASDKVSDDELKVLFNEVGADLNGERVIHVEDMIKAWKEHNKSI